MHSLTWFLPFFNGLLLGLAAMALHEVGHTLAALAVGVRVKSIGFRWKGLYVVREAGPPAKNLLISVAGPLTNLLLIACWHWSYTFGLANLCFAFFNILPLQGSDGDRALSCWDQMRMAEGKPPRWRSINLASTVLGNGSVSRVPHMGD